MEQMTMAEFYDLYVATCDGQPCSISSRLRRILLASHLPMLSYDLKVYVKRFTLGHAKYFET